MASQRGIQFLIDFVTRGAQQATQAIASVQAAARQAQTPIMTMARASAQAGQSMQTFWGAMTQPRSMGMDWGNMARWAIGWTLLYRSIRLVESGIMDMIRGALELDQAMHNINTIARMSAERLATMRDELINMSTTAEGGFRPVSELAQGLYLINSAGIIGAESMGVLKAAASAAMAGLSDTATAVTAIVSTLNAYGLSAKDATMVSDVLFQTVQLGVPTFEQLARNWSLSATLGAALGVDIRELGLAWAALSRNMTDAAKTNVALSQLMVSFIKPSDAMKNAIKTLGYESGAAMVKELGLFGALKALQTIARDDPMIWAALVQNRRALQAVLAFLKDDFKLVNETMADNIALGGDVGATMKAQAEQAKSYATQVKILKANFEALKLELGTSLLPTLNKGVQAFTNLFRAIHDIQAGATRGQRAERLWMLTLAMFEDLPKGLTGGGGVATPTWRLLQERHQRLDREQNERLRRALAGPLEAPRLQRPPAQFLLSPSFEDIMRQFQLARTRAAGDFRATELAALTTTVLPAALKRQADLEKELVEITKRRGEQARLFARDLSQEVDDSGKLTTEAKKARDVLKEMEDIERTIAQLEADRVRLVKDLVQEYKRLGEAYQAAVFAMQRGEIAAEEDRIRGINAVLELSADALQQFRDYAGEAFDPEKAKQFREQIQQFNLQRITNEIATLERILSSAMDPQERTRAGQRLRELYKDRAKMQADYLVENRTAEQKAWDEQDQRIRERNDRLRDLMKTGTPEQQAWAYRLLTAPDIRPRRPKDLTQQEIADPFDLAKKKIDDINTVLKDIGTATIKKLYEEAVKVRKPFEDITAEINKWPGALREVIELLRQMGQLPGQGANQPAGSRQFGGGIPFTGPYMLHRGESVLPKWLVEKFGGSQNIMRILARMDVFGDRTDPRRRPIDWLAYGFGWLADAARGYSHNTAIEREEAYLRTLQSRRSRERGTVGFVDMPTMGGGGRSGPTVIINGMTVTGQDAERLASLLMGIVGDRAIQRERRYGTAGQVA